MKRRLRADFGLEDPQGQRLGDEEPEEGGDRQSRPSMQRSYCCKQNAHQASFQLLNQALLLRVSPSAQT